MKMGHKKHGHCPYAQVEDAPKVLGHASISKGAVGATAGGGHHGQGTTSRQASTAFLREKKIKFYFRTKRHMRKNSSLS